MSDLKASPRNELLGALSDMLASAKYQGNRVTIPEQVPLLGGSGIGDMLLGQSPEEVDRWSYGNYPMRMAPEGTGSRIPQVQQGRQQALADTMFTAGDLGALSKAVPKLSRVALENAFTSPTSTSPLAQMGAIDPSKRNFLRNLGKLNQTEPSPITQVVEQTTPEATSSGVSRRGFLGMLGAGALSAVTPGVLKELGKTIDEPLLSAGTKAAEHVVEQAAPHVASAVTKALSEGLSLKDALLATTSRITEHNRLAKEQAKARAEAGITDLIEGHVAPMKTLKTQSGIVDEDMGSFASVLKKRMGKVPPLTKQQKLENRVYNDAHDRAYNDAQVRYKDLVKDHPYYNMPDLTYDKYPEPTLEHNSILASVNNRAKELKYQMKLMDSDPMYQDLQSKLLKASEEQTKTPTKEWTAWRKARDDFYDRYGGLKSKIEAEERAKIPANLPHHDKPGTLTNYFHDIAQEVEPKTIQTGWGGNPEITHRYVPGVGHYVEHGQGEMPYYIKATDGPLPDEVIVHEYLNTMNELGVE